MLDDRALRSDRLSFAPERREPLLRWAEANFPEASTEPSASTGEAVDRTPAQKALHFSRRWLGLSRLGLAGLGVAGVGSAVWWADHGSMGMPLFRLFEGALALTTVQGGILAGAATVKAAKARGEGPLAAFGSLCKRMALGGLRIVAINPMPLAVIAVFPVGFALDKAIDAVVARNPQSKLLPILDPALNGVAKASHAAKRASDKVTRWRAGLALKTAKLDGPEIAKHKAYRSMARAWLRCRLRLDGPVLGEKLSAQLGVATSQAESFDAAFCPGAAAFRDAHCKHFENGDHTPAELMARIDLIDAAGVDPWFKPVPGLPTLAELALSLRAWQDILQHAPMEGLDQRLDAMSARCEAEELRGAVGAPAPLLGSDRPRAKARL